MMTRKTSSRSFFKERVSQNRKHEPFPDEITLKDEILELKRQALILKRTNEHYLVKLRKYEDEAKQKDKQVELLLDPRKNADVTKFLSTKGAAILMNLKDQNNALIQMLLDKDLHIRKLVAEIKMSKLYASTRKNESLRAEINRLRNLLIKSQETLKENIQVQQRQREQQQQQQQTGSICVSGNSHLEFSSSDQSTPRDLDELRATILSLETHIKHSNDLISEKNQEISHLTSELSFLRSFFRHKSRKNKNLDSNQNEFSPSDFTCKWSDPFASTKIDLSEEKRNETTPASSSKWFPTVDSSPKCFQVPEKRKENQAEESAVVVKKNEEKFPLFGKSLFHNLAANEILKEEKILSNCIKTKETKEKWLKALTKYRELKKTNPEIFAGRDDSDSREGIKTERKPEVVETTKETETNPSSDETCQSTAETIPTDGREEKECQNKEQNGSSTESSQNEVDSEKEKEVQKREPLKEIYDQSFDSSFDSDSSFSTKREIRQVQVEVQIYSFSNSNVSDRSEKNFSKNNQMFECDVENGGNDAPDPDSNDDDDVIIREK